MNSKDHVFSIYNYRINAKPYLEPSGKQRNDEAETRRKNRAKRKRLKRSKR